MEQYSVIDAPLKKKAVQNDKQIDAVKLKGRKTFVLWITHLLNYHNTIDFLKYNEKKEYISILINDTTQDGKH